MICVTFVQNVKEAIVREALPESGPLHWGFLRQVWDVFLKWEFRSHLRTFDLYLYLYWLYPYLYLSLSASCQAEGTGIVRRRFDCSICICAWICICNVPVFAVKPWLVFVHTSASREVLLGEVVCLRRRAPVGTPPSEEEHVKDILSSFFQTLFLQCLEHIVVLHCRLLRNRRQMQQKQKHVCKKKWEMKQKHLCIKMWGYICSCHPLCNHVSMQSDQQTKRTSGHNVTCDQQCHMWSAHSNVTCDQQCHMQSVSHVISTLKHKHMWVRWGSRPSQVTIGHHGPYRAISIPLSPHYLNFWPNHHLQEV